MARQRSSIFLKYPANLLTFSIEFSFRTGLTKVSKTDADDGNSDPVPEDHESALSSSLSCLLVDATARVTGKVPPLPPRDRREK